MASQLQNLTVEITDLLLDGLARLERPRPGLILQITTVKLHAI